MTPTGLNGWTSQRLDDLAADVREIKRTLVSMQSHEMQELRDRVKLAEARPRQTLYAFGAPLLAAAVTALLAILTHVA